MNKKLILKITYTSIFAALITLAVSVIKFSTGMGEGYIHLGDSLIYLVSCVLPFPYCLIAGALGGALADVLGGFAVWAVPTAIIKSLNTLPFILLKKKSTNNKILNKYTVLAALLSGIVTVIGYFAAECILYSVESATLSLLGNFIQATASGIIFIIIAGALDKTKFKTIFKEL